MILSDITSKIVDIIKELIPVITLAGFGGVTNTLAGKKREEKYSFKIAIPEIIIAIFCGLVIHYILLEFHVSDNLRTAAIALAGYSARGVLMILNKVFFHKLKKL